MRKGKKYKVGISGSYGGMNLGDEAILQSITGTIFINKFLTGTHNSAFSVNFDGDNLTWTLNGVNKIASKKSPACP